MAITKKCERCGKNFTTKPALAERMYCSMKCYHANRAKTLFVHKCAMCDKVFKNDRPDSKYCCRKCTAKGFSIKITKTCLGCKKTFNVIPSYKQREFCSRKCRDRHKRKQAVITKVCLSCQKTFSCLTYHPNTKYCSNKCRQEGRKKQSPITCQHCEKVFMAPRYRQSAKYCSKKCAEDAGRITKICPLCNKPFTIVKNKKNQTCCSRRCSSKLKKRTYIELAVREWIEPLGISFIEQHRIGAYTCDFVFPSLHLIIETDGEYWHSIPKVIERDKRKDKFLIKQGYTILRLSEIDIRNNPEWCKLRIISYLK